jgi:hypothetical protein
VDTTGKEAAMGLTIDPKPFTIKWTTLVAVAGSVGFVIGALAITLIHWIVGF